MKTTHIKTALFIALFAITPMIVTIIAPAVAAAGGAGG